MIEMKHNINSIVKYVGEFKNSHDQPYVVKRTHRKLNGEYVYDVKSINKPKGSKRKQHAEELFSLEYKELVKI